MSLRFPYLPVPMSGPVPPTLPAHVTARWRPLVPVRMTNAASGQFHDFDAALVDTGADDCLFPETVARRIGIQFVSLAGSRFRVRWRGTWWPMQFGEVLLTLADGVETWSWLACVAFSPAPVPQPILGTAGCLQFINATYRGVDRLLELEASATFPGSIT